MIRTTLQRVTPAYTHCDGGGPSVLPGSSVPAPCASCAASIAARFPHTVTGRTVRTVQLTCAQCGTVETYTSADVRRLLAGE